MSRARAVILVGGMGTRLRPLTVNTPKALLPVLNRPFLAYQLEILRSGGVRDVVLAVGRSARPWEKPLKKLLPKGMTLGFSFEQELMGTGGAIRLGYETLKKKCRGDMGPVVVFNGDVFFDLDVAALVATHREKGSHCTIGLTRVEDPSRFGVVDTAVGGRIVRFVEKPQGPPKPSYINAGAYVFEPNLIEKIPGGRAVSIEKESYPAFLAEAVPMFGFPIEGYWNDIGTPPTFLQAHHDILFGNNRWTPKSLLTRSVLQLGAHSSFKSSREFNGRALFGDRCSVGRNVTIEGHVCCGQRVRVDDDALLKDSVILEGTSIGRGARIQGAIVGKNCRIGDFADLPPGTVIGDGSVLTSYTRC